MAEIEPPQALHYNLEKTGGLQTVVAPPYDVIGAEQRQDLAARSPYNVVKIDLPVGENPYREAAKLFAAWKADNVLERDARPALWVLSQDYIGPDGLQRTRTGFFARVRVEEYGAGRIRPHERTHPGPKEDRLKLPRATRATLSPFFSLFDDSSGMARAALEDATQGPPWGEATEEDGTVNRLWRIEDEVAIATVQKALKSVELLIADGHHRYETARVYAEEIGGEGPHRYVLMCLVALQDPGLTVFPTHRLIRGLRPDQHETLASALRRDFDIERLDDVAALAPASADAVQIGYIDAHFKQPFMLTLRDPAIADGAMPDRAEPYRRLDTAVLEALILKGALGMTDEAIDHLAQLGYERDPANALNLVQAGEYDAAFLMAPIPLEQVQAVAASGGSMPPKSTYF